MNTRYTRTRSYYFAQLVADYFTAWGRYPQWHEFRPLFICASRKAQMVGHLN